MDGRFSWLALVGFLIWSGTAANASSITYKAEEVVFDGLPIDSAQTAPTLPNLISGGSITLTNFGYSNSQVAAGSDLVKQISGGFGFLIQGFDSSGNAVGPLVSVDGQYQGMYYGGGNPGRQSVSFTGVAASIGTGIGGDPVPEALQNLASNPGRLTVSSFITGYPGSDTDETLTLTLAPQVTPEPSTLILMASMLGAGGIYRSRRRKS